MNINNNNLHTVSQKTNTLDFWS